MAQDSWDKEDFNASYALDFKNLDKLKKKRRKKTKANKAEIQKINDAAEATQAFQGVNFESDQNDPMMLAIQREIGQQFAPLENGERVANLDQIEQPYTSDEVFRAVNLTKSYGTGAAYTEVIKGISFVVKDGDYVVIVGPSGSGKSTLLHILAGLEEPTRGEIRVRNQSFSNFNDDDMAFYHREEIGLVFQNFNLLESLTVWENVAFPLMLSGAPLEWRKHEALRILQHFHLEDFANHYPNQLSGGQQQRVSLARALVHDPELILIDEPTGNLDSKSAKIVIDEIERLHKQENRTIILVTHSRDFLSYASRVFYIRDGTLLQTNERDSINTV